MPHASGRAEDRAALGWESTLHRADGPGGVSSSRATRIDHGFAPPVRARRGRGVCSGVAVFGGPMRPHALELCPARATELATLRSVAGARARCRARAGVRWRSVEAEQSGSARGRPIAARALRLHPSGARLWEIGRSACLRASVAQGRPLPGRGQRRRPVHAGQPSRRGRGQADDADDRVEPRLNYAAGKRALESTA
jgi:hypothetical protein